MTSISTESIKGNSSKASANYWRKVIFVAATISFGAILVIFASSGGGAGSVSSGLRLGFNKRQSGADGGGGSAGKVEGEEKDGAHEATSARTEGEGRLVEFTISNLDGEVGRTGTIKVQTHPEWAPIGVERFHELVEQGFWNNCKFFRVLPDFVDQIGISGDPQVQEQWRSKVIKDDPVMKTNARGTLTFATSGKDTRTTQIFFNTNTKGNAFLDKQGFSPFGEVVEGMEIVDRIYDGDREKPNQGKIQNQGNKYLDKEFPRLSYFSDAKFV